MLKKESGEKLLSKTVPQRNQSGGWSKERKRERERNEIVSSEKDIACESVLACESSGVRELEYSDLMREIRSQSKATRNLEKEN